MRAPAPSPDRGNPLAGLPNIRPHSKGRSVLIIPPRACGAARQFPDGIRERERS